MRLRRVALGVAFAVLVVVGTQGQQQTPPSGPDKPAATAKADDAPVKRSASIRK